VRGTARCAKRQRRLGEMRRATAGLPAVMRRYGKPRRRSDSKTKRPENLSKHLVIAILDEKREAAGEFAVLEQVFPPTIKSGPSSVRSGTS
jgi:hypothetical protein